MKFQFEEQLVLHITSKFLPVSTVESITPIYTGHINKTFRVTVAEGGSTADYLLQNLNTHVFTQPEKVMHNIVRCSDFLHTNCPDYPYEILTPIASAHDGHYLVENEGLSWRMFEFISNSRSQDKVSDAEEARTIGEAFGVFLSYVNRDRPEEYQTTIPDFHNFSKRYQKFQADLEKLGKIEDERTRFLISAIENSAPEYLQLESMTFPMRIIHHDTKVNNVMLDRTTGKPKCIIDLDTLMPGHIFSDLGDLIRTLLNPYEEDTFPENGNIMDENVTSSLLDGFLSPIEQMLTNSEKEYLIAGSKKITLLQVLRFLDDHLKGDVYYQVAYRGHNLDRALSQMYLYQGMERNELLNTQKNKQLMK